MTPPIPATSPFRFSHRLRVRWGECDMQGVVFNPHYMAYVDVALTEYWRAINHPYPSAFTADGVDTFMAAANQTYLDAALFDDELDILIRTAYLGTTSLRLAFEIHRATTPIFNGTATYVIANRTTRKPTPLSPHLRHQITTYEHTLPDQKKP